MIDVIKKKGRPVRRDLAWKSLAGWLVRCDWTIPDIADGINTTRQTMYRWLSTARSPDIGTLRRLCLVVCRGDSHLSTTMLYDVLQDGILSYDGEAVRLMLSIVCPKRDAAISLIQKVFFASQK